MVATTTIARAFQALADIHQYVASKTYRRLAQELIGSYDGKELDILVATTDVLAAQTRGTDRELEHVDLFCLVRDYRYGQRSRRYLYQQAQQEKLRYAYEEFMYFARENTSYDLAGIIEKGQADPAALTKLALADFQVKEFKI